MKVCIGCALEKPSSDFYKGKNKCKSCYNEYLKQWLAKNPDKRLEYNRAAKLGLSVHELRDAIAAFDPSSCAICSTSERLYLDHDHATNQPRGFLCQKCNSGLGMFEDDVSRIEKAAAYLRGDD